MRHLGLIPLAGMAKIDDIRDIAAIQVRRRRDTARPAKADGVDHRQFGPRIDNQPVDGEEAARIVPVAGAVLDADDDIRIGGAKPRHQINRQADAGDLRDVVEVNLQIGMVDTVDQLLEIIEIAIITHALEIEGWQRHHTGAAKLDSVPRQGDAFRQVAQPGAGNDAFWIDTRFDQPLDGGHPLGAADRQRLTSRAERGKSRTSRRQQFGGKFVVEFLVE